MSFLLVNKIKETMNRVRVLTGIWKHILRSSLVLAASALALSVGYTSGIPGVSATGELPPGPDRFTSETQSYTAYTWWLVNWNSSATACQLMIDHDGLPTGSEIYTSCGADLYSQWHLTGPCDRSQADPASCKGVYLQYVSSAMAQRQVELVLPPPVVWVSLEGCAPRDISYVCSTPPTLVLTGEEPITGEDITAIGGSMDGRTLSCDPGQVCRVPLAVTGDQAVTVQFWAFSSYGDSSQVFSAQVRVIAGDTQDASQWVVDIISTQLQGPPLSACSQIWGSFPPVSGLSPWLSTPLDVTNLASDIPYEYLAAKLITWDLVDVSACSDNGLTSDGFASACGMEAAGPAIKSWQNRFDESIFSAAQDKGIPAHLLKNIFGRESQFWPGVFNYQVEAGLGQLTQKGADSALMWNPSLYGPICAQNLSSDTCSSPYAQLKPETQTILQQALVDSVDATCQDCDLGLDLTNAESSIPIFAEVLVGNCTQAGLIVKNATGRTPGLVSSYEDLWRFTLVNYNGGPGCLILAVKATLARGEPLDWTHVSSHLTPVCQPAADYVAQVSH